jgi:hypothetical protein
MLSSQGTIYIHDNERESLSVRSSLIPGIYKLYWPFKKSFKTLKESLMPVLGLGLS